MGGLVAMELAAAAPGRYWALGLVATTAQPPSPDDRRIRDERAEATERDGMRVLLDYMQSGLYSPASCPPAVRSRVDAMMAAALTRGRRRGAARPGPAGPTTGRCSRRRSTSPRSSWPGRRIPWSDAAVTDEIRRSPATAGRVMIEGAGHLPNLEVRLATEFNEALLSFLGLSMPRKTRRPRAR